VIVLQGFDMRGFQSFPAIATALAAISMAATPASAAPFERGAPSIAVPTPGVFEAEAANADSHRWYRYRRHHHVDTGDVLAGVLIIGGIAAIANAASNNRDRDYRNRDGDYRSRDDDYRDRRTDSRYNDARGIDRAVAMCVNEIERDVRVDTVDGVERNGSGWDIRGTLYNGDRFDCQIGPDGRVRNLDIDGRDVAQASPPDDRQWDDSRYASARARIDNAAPATDEGAAQPAYPGGPLPGEEVDGDLAADSGVDDGRYEAYTAPDLGQS